MATVVLRHSPLLAKLGMPLAAIIILGLVAIGVLGALSPWLYDPDQPDPMKMPVWARVAGGGALAAYFAKYLWDLWHTRHGYFEQLTLDDSGIHVESDSGPAFFVPWSNVVEVDNLTPFLVRVRAHDRSRPIYLINNGWTGFSREFQVAKELVREHAGIRGGNKC